MLSPMRTSLVIAILLALPLLADDLNKETLSTTHTDTFNVPTAGAIKIKNSFGEVDIDGWDRHEVEVTVVRSSQHFYDSAERGEAQRSLEGAQIKAEQDGNDVVISTAYIPWNGPHGLSRRSEIGISYHIKAPRASKLIVDHNSGGVNISNISGDIHAAVINGQITLSLAAAGQYAIDSQAKIGDVYSDFEGHYQRRHLLGKEFVRQSPAPAANLYLRVRYGDIMILKLHGPPVDLTLSLN
jgi:hypothetical protein